MNKIPQPKIALVAGASGIVGRELVKTLLRNRWEVIGLSRQASPHLENIPFIHVDLLDAQHSAQKLHSLNGVTHIFYSAWANAGNWAEMVEPNVTMLRNLVSNIEQTAPLRTVSLMQGYKVYGAHLGPFKTPARESDPGVPGAEFNAAQLTWLSHFQRGKTWHWNAIRPGVVGSTVPGNAMNLALSIAIYASLCKAQIYRCVSPVRKKPGTASSIIRTPGCWLMPRCGPRPRQRRKTRRSTSITATSGAGASCGRASRAGLNWHPLRRSECHFTSCLWITARTGANWPGRVWWKRTS